MVEGYLATLGPLGLFSYRDERLPCAPMGNLKRPDFTWILPTHVVILEVDEQAHQMYEREKELERLVDLYDQAQGFNIIVLRFNPLVRHLQHLRDALWIAIHDPPPSDKIDVRFIAYPDHAIYDLDIECVLAYIDARDSHRTADNYGA
jgi:hypothetical protein